MTDIRKGIHFRFRCSDCPEEDCSCPIEHKDLQLICIWCGHIQTKEEAPVV